MGFVIWAWWGLTLCAITYSAFALFKFLRSKKVLAVHSRSLAEKVTHNAGVGPSGRAAHRAIQKKIERWGGSLTKRQAEHIEMLAAAYWKYSDVPPTEMELVQEIISHEKVVWYFQPRATAAKERA